MAENKDDQTVSLTLGGAKRMADVVRAYEGQPRTKASSALGVFPDRAIRYAKVTEAITARDGTTLGEGRVQLYYDNDGELTPYPGLSPVVCKNIIGGTNGVIALGKWCIVVIVDGKFAAFVAEC